jgi:hypothetical protein
MFRFVRKPAVDGIVWTARTLQSGSRLTRRGHLLSPATSVAIDAPPPLFQKSYRKIDQSYQGRDRAIVLGFVRFSGPDLTKMFHVKHFGTIGTAKNERRLVGLCERRITGSAYCCFLQPLRRGPIWPTMATTIAGRAGRKRHHDRFSREGRRRRTPIGRADRPLWKRQDHIVRGLDGRGRRAP